MLQSGQGVWILNPYEETDETFRRGRALDSRRCGRPVYVRATVIEANNGKVVVETKTEPRKSVESDASKCFFMDAATEVDDMVDLAHLNDATLLNNVQTRYQRECLQQIYTMAGEILIAVNPYRDLVDHSGTSIYDGSYVTKYRHNFATLPPHIFSTAASAVKAIREENENQSVVISGESGAGKTESTKQIMKFITSCSESKNDVTSKLLQSNPVLEALGNAKTLRNDNSSRFGKFIKINLDSSSKVLAICGGSIQEFLLEKSRVVNHNHGERNYHVFYQILAGLSNTERTQLGLNSCVKDDFRYLNPAHQRKLAEELGMETTPIEIAGSVNENSIDDKAAFQELQKSLEIIGLCGTQTKAMFRILAGLLHLGNIKFKGDSEAIVDMCASSSTALDMAAKLLGLKPDELRNELVMKETIMNGSVIQSPLRLQRAFLGTDALAKAIYGRIFCWVVREINNTLESTESKRQRSYIGILDIFGFEVFKKNGFEQFCINFANEKLHQLFTTHVFKLEEKIYEEERIDYSEITFADNQGIIDLVESKRRGIIALLNEACLFPSSTDESFVTKLDQSHDVESSKHYRPATVKERINGPAFVVLHSAATVVYSASEFLSKNRDRLESNLLRILSTSEESLVRTLFEDMQDGTAGKFTGSNAFLGPKFKEDISKLMDTLNSTTPHFVRCLKPNSEKRSGFFEPKLVLHQLRYLGVLDSIRIRHSGYSFRKRYADFYSRFALIASHLESPARLEARAANNESLFKSKCSELVGHLWSIAEEEMAAFQGESMSSHIQFGITKLFMRKSVIQIFEAIRTSHLRAMDDAAAKIQSILRMHSVSRKIIVLRRGLARLRACWFAIQERKKFLKHYRSRRAAKRAALVWNARTQFLRRKRAVLEIQAFAKCAPNLKRFRQMRSTAKKVQSAARRFLLRKKIQFWTRIATILQSVARSYLVRLRLHKRRIWAAQHFQAAWRSYADRLTVPEFVNAIREFRFEQLKRRCARRIQGQWFTFLTSKRFCHIKASAEKIATWHKTLALSEEFRTARQAAIHIQRLFRGFSARLLRDHLKTELMLDFERKRICERLHKELEAIDAMNLRRFANPKKRCAAFRRTVDTRSNILSSQPRQVHTLIDLDLRTDPTQVYPKTWAESIWRLDEIKDMASSNCHTIVLKADGALVWLGKKEVDIRLTEKVTQVSATAISSVFLTSTGKVLESGSPTRTPRVVLSGQRKVVKISSGSKFTLALTNTGSIYSWEATAPEPKLLTRLYGEHIVEISAGFDFALALTRKGTVYSWGSNSNGQLGLCDRKPREIPQKLDLPPCSQICAGGRHAGAVDSSGALYLWGWNHRGELGAGHLKDLAKPQKVNALAWRVSKFVLGWRSTFVLDENDRLHVFGLSQRFGENIVPFKVPMNLCLAGRSVTRLIASNSATSSFVSVIYAQNPAPLDVVTIPLLGQVVGRIGRSGKAAGEVKFAGIEFAFSEMEETEVKLDSVNFEEQQVAKDEKKRKQKQRTKGRDAIEIAALFAREKLLLNRPAVDSSHDEETKDENDQADEVEQKEDGYGETVLNLSPLMNKLDFQANRAKKEAMQDAKEIWRMVMNRT